MAKTQTTYVCQECGAQSPKWSGKCSSCDSWNTLEEIHMNPKAKANVHPSGISLLEHLPIKINDIPDERQQRIVLHNNELNRVLGGGVMQGSIILIGGEPGIGKSTLMLQAAIALHPKKVLYISGEESGHQIKSRAERIGYNENNSCYILTETSLESILNHIRQLKPDIVFIDSIQTLSSSQLESTSGTVSQVKECAYILQQYAKYHHIPIILIGHITKDGALAGPKVLEHIVDVVLQFEGDRNYDYRILRTIKNRFGASGEIGIFEMQENGLHPVTNPSQILLSHNDENLSGIAISASIEGLRPLLIEAQALVTPSAYGMPQRSTTGFDARRLNMLLAVLEKRNGFHLSSKDIFLNIAGGIKTNDPCIDLSVVAAIISSYDDLPLDPKCCFSAEVGLSGEIRNVNRIEQRISEAEKMGFQKFFLSAHNTKGIAKSIHHKNISIIPVKTITEFYKHLF